MPWIATATMPFSLMILLQHIIDFQHIAKKLLVALTLTVCLALLPFAPTIAQSDSLPELGDPASQTLNPQQEAEIGLQFYNQLLAAPNYIADQELQHYLNQLGRQISSNSSLPDTPLHFNFLQENELNAFAVPGGYITFHSGLLLATESESELASVVGHEIAHLSQRHLPRMLARANAAKIPTTAAIIASILIGGRTGIAGITLANANALSRQLAYSRKFEQEADAIGMKMMANSGYDPKAMAGFFNKLQRFNLLTNQDVPEFLRAHPLSYTRIAEAEARQSSYKNTAHHSSFAFLLAKAKIQALYAGRPETAEQVLAEQVKQFSGIEKDAAIYGLALAKMRLRQFEDAVERLQPVLSRHPDNPSIQLAQAEIELAAGNSANAVKLYHALTQAKPELIYLNYFYLNALLRHKDAATAKKLCRYLLRRHPAEFMLYRPLSKANVQLGLHTEAHQADAEYFSALGKYQNAIAALKLAIRDNQGHSQYLKQSITARIAELERSAGIDNTRKKP